MSSIQNLISSSINSCIVQKNFDQARQLLDDSKSILPMEVQKMLRDKISQCAGENLSLGEGISSRKRARSSSLEEEPNAKKIKVAPKQLNRDIVRIIASFEEVEDFTDLLRKRCVALFESFDHTYSPDDLKEALRVQMKDLSAFPNEKLLGYYGGVEKSQTDPTFFLYIEPNQTVVDDKIIKDICEVTSRILEGLKGKKIECDYFAVAKTLSLFFPKEIQMFKNNSFNGNQLTLSKEIFTDSQFSPEKVLIVPILELILLHFQNDPLRLQLTKERKLNIYDLKFQGGKWVLITRSKEAFDFFPMKFLYTFMACQGLLSQEQLDEALWETMYERPFFKEDATALINQGADIEKLDYFPGGFINILKEVGSRETSEALIEFFLNYKLSDWMLAALFAHLNHPISQKTNELIGTYNKTHPKIYNEAMKSFFSQLSTADPNTYFKHQAISKKILVNSLLILWLKADLNIKNELPQLHFKSLINNDHPLTEILEESHQLKITSVTDAMVLSLLQWFQAIHIGFIKQEPYLHGLDETALIQQSVTILLKNLEKRGVSYSRQDLVAALMKQLDHLPTDPVEKMVASIPQSNQGLIGIIDGLRG